MKYLEDGELLELSERVAGKLEAMSDEDLDIFLPQIDLFWINVEFTTF